ncbi:AAA family ATPase [Bacteroides acidifaciens]|uniref:AAA family ATPase n=1 Tax=Bacteroides acidifaciens TaxID=85831 RepID=UPI00301489D1
MLRFNNITIENFGPYFGTQTISLSEQDGVTFLWGLNGFGKTSFLNAIRFALWGSLSNSKYASRPLVKFVNRKAIAEGKSMMVRLDCVYKKQKCVIIRHFIRKPYGDGTKQEDYEYSFTVSLDAKTLSQEEALDFLQRTLPSDISRFYLFDAELLDQYEQLVEENDNNVALKEEIEKILGLPILQQAKSCFSVGDHIRLQLDRELDRATKEQKQNTKAKKAYDVAVGLRDQYISEIDELKFKLNSLHIQRQELEDTLTENEQFKTLVVQEKQLKGTLENQESLLQNLKAKLSDCMGTLWTIYFDKSIDVLVSSWESERKDLSKELEETHEESVLFELLTILQARDAKECPICSNDISKKSLQELINRLKSNASHFDTRMRISNLADKISHALQQKGNHSKNEVENALNDYILAFERYNNLIFELENVRSKKKTYHTNVTESSILKIASDFSTIVNEISIGEMGLAKAEDNLSKTKEDIERLRKEISKNGDEIVKRIDAQRDFVDTLEAIFDDGIAWFRNELKENVQESASEIFRHISHNKDYVGLKINDNFGLEIVLASGDDVPNRSEGYEQIVALSLIAALHKNAPIAGPIIMDSTFQRIDPIHKEATLRELPNLGRQIIVLVYPSEIDKDNAKKALGAFYLKDLELEQIDSLETKIKKQNDK